MRPGGLGEGELRIPSKSIVYQSPYEGGGRGRGGERSQRGSSFGCHLGEKWHIVFLFLVNGDNRLLP